MTFVEDNGAASPEALADFELKLGQLPDDYREFIAAHNGVRLSGSADVRIDTPLGPEFWGVDTIEGVQDTEFWVVDYPTGSMPVATDGGGNTYLMGLVGELRGRIYFHDHELASEVPEPLESLQCLVESFGTFLAGVRDFDPDDPESEALFHLLIERRREVDQQRDAILNPKKPWWKLR